MVEWQCDSRLRLQRASGFAGCEACFANGRSAPDLFPVLNRPLREAKTPHHNTSAAALPGGISSAAARITFPGDKRHWKRFGPGLIIELGSGRPQNQQVGTRRGSPAAGGCHDFAPHCDRTCHRMDISLRIGLRVSRQKGPQRESVVPVFFVLYAAAGIFCGRHVALGKRPDSRRATALPHLLRISEGRSHALSLLSQCSGGECTKGKAGGMTPPALTCLNESIYQRAT